MNLHGTFVKFDSHKHFQTCSINYMYVFSSIIGTGNTVIKAVNILKEHKVPEESIVLLNLFITPYGKAGECLHQENMSV